MTLHSSFAPRGARRPGASLLAAALTLGVAATACEDNPGEPEPRAQVAGVVSDPQTNAQLFFYDDELNQLGPFGIPVRQDGSYGPVSLTVGVSFAAGTAPGFTTGAFQRIEIRSPDDSLTINFDMDPLTVPLAVGNRWTYEETLASSTTPRTVTVEITAEQAGEEVGAVYTVEERRTDDTGAPVTATYFLAQDAQGIRKSQDATIDPADELLLRLPAAIGSSWSTVDFQTGAALTKRIRAISCDDGGCVETNDFTIAQEPAGTFMSISVLYDTPNGNVVSVFSDVGIVDEFVQAGGTGALVSQRRLASFTAGAGP